jgi:hypothetical protein
VGEVIVVAILLLTVLLVIVLCLVYVFGNDLRRTHERSLFVKTLKSRMGNVKLKHSADHVLVCRLIEGGFDVPGGTQCFLLATKNRLIVESNSIPTITLVVAYSRVKTFFGLEITRDLNTEAYRQPRTKRVKCISFSYFDEQSRVRRLVFEYNTSEEERACNLDKPRRQDMVAYVNNIINPMP